MGCRTIVMKSGTQTKAPQKSQSASGLSSGLFVGAFMFIAFLLLPTNPADAASSYVVTETVETLEYEIRGPFFGELDVVLNYSRTLDLGVPVTD